MPNPVWPPSLQSAPGADAARTRESNVIRSPMEYGPPKMRRRASRAATRLKFSLLVDAAQRTALETFYLDTLAEVLPFDWQDFFAEGFPAATFRFVAPPQYQNVSGVLWSAAIELEQLS